MIFELICFHCFFFIKRSNVLFSSILYKVLFWEKGQSTKIELALTYKLFFKSNRMNLTHSVLCLLNEDAKEVS